MFYQLPYDKFLNFPPESISILGLLLNFIGAILLSIEALKPKKFISELENKVDYKARMTKTSFDSTIDQTFVFIFISAISFFVFLIFIPHTNLYFDICLAPTGFLIWKILIIISEYLNKLIKILGPTPKMTKHGCLPGLLYLCLVIPWAIVFRVSGLIEMIIHYGIDLPLRFLSEKVIGSLFLKIYYYLNKISINSERFNFNALAFRGALLFIFGFLLQLIGVIAAMIK